MEFPAIFVMILGLYAEDTDNTHNSRSPAARAVIAGMKIIENVSSICRKYQKKMEHGLDNFGPAIGVHCEGAIWIANDEGIHAIGPSIVGASRLCQEAGQNQIVISNATNVALQSDYRSKHLFTFHKKTVRLKEYLGTNTYAYALTMGDSDSVVLPDFHEEEFENNQESS